MVKQTVVTYMDKSALEQRLSDMTDFAGDFAESITALAQHTDLTPSYVEHAARILISDSGQDIAYETLSHISERAYFGKCDKNVYAKMLEQSIEIVRKKGLLFLKEYVGVVEAAFEIDMDHAIVDMYGEEILR